MQIRILALVAVSISIQPLSPHSVVEPSHRALQLMQVPGVRTTYSDMVAILNTAEYQGRTCLPGVFDSTDFLSMAFVESRFYRHARGGAGERGVWQILDWPHMLRAVGGTDAFDIATSGRMACAVLQDKHRIYLDYRRTMQAYNGYRPHMRSYPYYRRVRKAKKNLFVTKLY